MATRRNVGADDECLAIEPARKCRWKGKRSRNKCGFHALKDRNNAHAFSDANRTLHVHHGILDGMGANDRDPGRPWGWLVPPAVAESLRP
ncbi:hypothetical protein E5D57_000454 [Metarhizium anisopliae]|nr:hypothetical protein E5D57_000454 [Metarhizium anisopliae]